MSNDIELATVALSVVLPVYNAERHLAETIHSIRNQTLKNFQVIAVDDGSTDRSYDLLMEHGDERFAILHRDRNRGLVRTLNAGVRYASCDLIARIDADDLMAVNRLQAQVEFMRVNPVIDICGSYFDYIDEQTRAVGDPLAFPVTHRAIRRAFRTFTAIGHPTVVFRRQRLREVLGRDNIYDPEYIHAEDLALWLECMAKGARFANIPVALTHYRRHAAQRSTEEQVICDQYTSRARKAFSTLWEADEDDEESPPLRDIRFVKKTSA